MHNGKEMFSLFRQAKQRPIFANLASLSLEWHPRRAVSIYSAITTGIVRENRGGWRDRYAIEKAVKKKLLARKRKIEKRAIRRRAKILAEFANTQETSPTLFQQRNWKEHKAPDMPNVTTETTETTETEPLMIPYTTSASEFLYGTSVVAAALEAKRRKFYKLYIHTPSMRKAVGRDKAIQKLAQAADVPLSSIGGTSPRLLDKMSSGRPHNGYILEASPLPVRPAQFLRPVDRESNMFEIQTELQSAEELAINGDDSLIPKLNPSQARYPFIVMLQNILDPGNLGAIIRSAYYFGADALAIASHNCAPISNVALKASAGAAESLPILSVSSVGQFMELSQDNNWRFYAAHTPSWKESSWLPKPIAFHHIPKLLDKSPCVLLLGNEGEGLSSAVLKKSDNLVTIQGSRAGLGGVDSLNVSVAAGLLCHAFVAGIHGDDPVLF